MYNTSCTIRCVQYCVPIQYCLYILQYFVYNTVRINTVCNMYKTVCKVYNTVYSVNDHWIPPFLFIWLNTILYSYYLWISSLIRDKQIYFILTPSTSPLIVCTIPTILQYCVYNTTGTMYNTRCTILRVLCNLGKHNCI